MNLKTAAVVFGIAVIFFGFTARRFYPGAWGVGDRTRTVPKWFGRAWFTAVGLWLIFMGLNTNPKAGNIVGGTISIAIGVGLIGELIVGIRRPPPADSRWELAKPAWFQKYIPLVAALLFILGGWAILHR